MSDTIISQAPQFFMHTGPTTYYRLSADGGVSKLEGTEWVWSAWGHLDPAKNREKFQAFDGSMVAINPADLPAAVFEGGEA